MRLLEWVHGLFGKKELIALTEKLETQAAQFAVGWFAVQLVSNFVAGVVAKCEFKTFSKGKEVKGEEYYLWNIEPNGNQNSSQFLQELVAKLLRVNEVLVVEVGGWLVLADSFTHTEYANQQDLFTNVCRGTLTYRRPFLMEDVLYLRLHDRNIRAALDEILRQYNALLTLAQGKYKRSGGRKGTLSLNKMPAGGTPERQLLDDLMNKSFAEYYKAENAVVPLTADMAYQEITGEGSRKSTSEIKDITDLIRAAVTQAAQAARVPPALLLGEVADVKGAMQNFLTVCIDPLCDTIEEEINRKRYGKAAYLSGTRLQIDTTCIQHMDVFEMAASVDKLIASSMYSVNELRRKLRETEIQEEWANEHVLTRNYTDVKEVKEE